MASGGLKDKIVTYQNCLRSMSDDNLLRECTSAYYRWLMLPRDVCDQDGNDLETLACEKECDARGKPDIWDRAILSVMKGGK